MSQSKELKQKFVQTKQQASLVLIKYHLALMLLTLRKSTLLILKFAKEELLSIILTNLLILFTALLQLDTALHLDGVVVNGSLLLKKSQLNLELAIMTLKVLGLCLKTLEEIDKLLL